MIVGIAIDSWKLPIFKRQLDAATLKYTEHPGLTQGTLLLKVTCDSVRDLQPIVQAANDACSSDNGEGQHGS